MSQHSSRGKDWERTRAAVLARDGYMCMVPGCTQPATHVDHITPKALGGTDEMDNLQSMCAPHNLKKGAKVYARQTYLNKEYFKNQ